MALNHRNCRVLTQCDLKRSSKRVEVGVRFSSNLGDGAAKEFVASPNQQHFKPDLGVKVLNEFDHYAAIEAASLRSCVATLSLLKVG